MLKSLKKFLKRFRTDRVFRFAFLNSCAAGFFVKDVPIYLFSIDVLFDNNLILSVIVKLIFWLIAAKLFGWTLQKKIYILNSAKSKKDKTFNEFINGENYWIFLVLVIIFTSLVTYCISHLFISNFSRWI